MAADGAPVSRIKKGIQRVVHCGENRRFFLQFLLDALVFGEIANRSGRRGARAILVLKQEIDRTHEQQKQDSDCEGGPGGACEAQEKEEGSRVGENSIQHCSAQFV